MPPPPFTGISISPAVRSIRVEDMLYFFIVGRFSMDFEGRIFFMTNYPWLDGYLLSKPGAEQDFKVEWQWERYLVRGKMFAAVCTPGRNTSRTPDGLW